MVPKLTKIYNSCNCFTVGICSLILLLHLYGRKLFSDIPLHHSLNPSWSPVVFNFPPDLQSTVKKEFKMRISYKFIVI
jgi:hypothetical protein